MSSAPVPALTAHAIATDRTAIYPHAGTGTVSALAYIGLGLGGESAEAVQKATAGDHPGLALELGDTLWYLARFHRELALDPQASLAAGVGQVRAASDPLMALVITAGRVQELVKKAVRDDGNVLSSARREDLAVALADVLGAWMDVHTRTGLDPSETADANIAKLADRRARHVLSGSGDHR